MYRLCSLLKKFCVIFTILAILSDTTKWAHIEPETSVLQQPPHALGENLKPAKCAAFGETCEQKPTTEVACCPWGMLKCRPRANGRGKHCVKYETRIN